MCCTVIIQSIFTWIVNGQVWLIVFLWIECDSSFIVIHLLSNKKRNSPIGNDKKSYVFIFSLCTVKYSPSFQMIAIPCKNIELVIIRNGDGCTNMDCCSLIRLWTCTKNGRFSFDGSWFSSWNILYKVSATTINFLKY